MPGPIRIAFPGFANAVSSPGKCPSRLVARRGGRLHDPPMIRLRGLGSISLRACVATVLLLAGNVRAAPSETGPAYGVEPGDAPKNAVPIGSTAPAPAAQSAPDPATTAPPPGGAGQPATTTATEVSDNDPRALSDF